VVFGFDDAVCGGALAGDVAVVRKGAGVSLWVVKKGFRKSIEGDWECERGEQDGVKCFATYRSTISPFSFSMAAEICDRLWTRLEGLRRALRRR
jgi:hypothetical protein